MSRYFPSSRTPRYLLDVLRAHPSIRKNAEQAVRDLLRSVARAHKGKDLHAVDYMDDGTPIELRVSIDEDKGSAVFDFEGTGDEVLGNVSGLAREETSVTFF